MATTASGARTPPAGSASVRADAAFVAFYRDFVPTLVAFLRVQGAPLVEAADLAQETMIAAYRRWETIEHPGTWARRVASRMWARRIASVVESPVGTVPEAGPLLVIANVAAWEQRHEVLQIIDELPPRQRQVLAWTLDGYTPAEIAAELRITAEAVRGSLAKARRALARHPRVTGEQP